MCPYSDYFGEDVAVLKQKLQSKGAAQYQVCCMVMRWAKAQALSSISEKISDDE